MQFSKKAAAATLAFALLFAGCGAKKITDPKQYVADHGAYVTGNGAYDVTGQVVLRSVKESAGGWKQLNFKVDTNAHIDDFYIVPLKAGVFVDDVALYDGGVDAELQSQFAKAVAIADFEELEELKKAYGFQTSADAQGRTGTVLKAEDTATKILYFVKDGKTQANAGVAEQYEQTDHESYGLSVWVNYEWSGTDYDNLLYIGINEAEQDITA